MKLRFLLILVLMALLLSVTSMAVASGPDWVPGYDATATTKAVLVYRHLFNPGKSGYEGFLGPCEGGYECNVGQATWDTNPAKYAATNKVTLVYDGAGKFTATIDPDGIDGPYVMETTTTFPAPGDLNYLQLTLRGQVGTGPVDEIVSFNNATLNGNPLSDVTGNTGTLDWNIKGVDLTGGFTLEGDMVLTWPQSNSGCDGCNKLKVSVGYVEPPTGIDVTTNTPLFCTGETSVVKIDLNSVTDVFGYQFEVSYDDAKVSASGAFVDSFFDTSAPASKPWNATCAAGKCQFSVSHVDPQLPVSGSGTVAEITFTGLNAGEFDVTISNDILSDKDANVIGHATGGPLHLTVCGYASASGVVSLQGRATPIDAGTVTLTNGAFAPYSTSFDPSTGAWSISNIKVMPGGTDYTFDAAHSLYLGNQMTHTLMPGDAYDAGPTKLKGGDADNSGLIDISDLSCIGGAFGGAPVVCGTTGSSDINADGTTNILDLVLPGGNYGLATPQAW